jgi:predicted Zn-dependent peptidase
MGRGHEGGLAAELIEGAQRVARPLCRSILALEHEAPHRRVDGREVAVEELLRVVGLGSDVCALAELEHGLERRRAIRAGSHHREALVARGSERLRTQLELHVRCEAAHVLAQERAPGGDRTRVARGVAVALLDPWGRDHHVVGYAGDRAARSARHEPRLALEALDRLAREGRLPLVADRDEDVRVGSTAEDDLERLRGGAARERGVERRPAAGEENLRSVGQPALADPLGNLPEPLGLGGDGRSGQLFGHGRCLYHRGVSVFEQTRLGNGIRVLTAPMPQVSSVACFVMLAAGSRYETPGSQGIAHFAEHMFFKGTERRPTARTISTEIDGIGGEFNAFTGKELTGYYVKCASETRDVALDVLVDMLRNSKFDSEEIDKEKGVILEEMNVYLDTPQRYVGNVYDRLLFGDQPLGWDILGTRETIEGTTRETFTSYLDAWYWPERIVVGVGGRIGDGLHDRLEELLGDIEPRETAVRPDVVIPPDGSPVLLHTKQSEQAHLILGVRGYDLGHPDRYALQLLAVVLGGGMSSRLFTEVRERRGLAYYVHAANASYTDAGSFYTGAGVDVTRIDEAITTIVGELRKVAAEPVPADELEKARGYAKGRFVLRLESPQAMVQFGLRREVLENETEEPDDVLRELDAVTAEDVQRVALDLLESKRLYLAVVGPFDDAERFEKLVAA